MSAERQPSEPLLQRMIETLESGSRLTGAEQARLLRARREAMSADRQPRSWRGPAWLQGGGLAVAAYLVLSLGLWFNLDSGHGIEPLPISLAQSSDWIWIMDMDDSRWLEDPEELGLLAWISEEEG